MRRLSVWIVSLLVVAIVTGCGGAHRYDQRLIAADSLMLSAPDSALALLTPICGDSLPTDGDRAYNALLLTQARYKCYEKITAADDSAITRAMDYYRTHDGEREKLTRAYLYKGAVMEELAHVDSAMLYYKTAEAVADEKDYVNLGQINTRIADLYRLYFADSQTCYHKFKQALGYYKLTGNKRLQLDCLFNMAGCSGVTHNDDAEELLVQATQLANELNDSLSFFKCQELLCRQLYYQGYSLDRAKAIALNCLNNYRSFVNNDLLLDLADIYAYSSMPDSAKFYLSYINPNVDVSSQGQIRTRTNMILSRIARLEGDTALSNHYDKLGHQISDSILNDKQKYLIQQIENESNTALSQKKVHTVHALNNLTVCLGILAVVTLLAFSLYHYRRTHRYDHIIADFKQQSASQLNDLSVLKQNIDKLQIQDDQLKSFISNHLNMTSEMIEACYHEPKSKLSHQVKRIVEFQHDNEHRWIQLFHYIDAEYNQIISKTRKAYPQLHDRDLLLIALTCMRFSQIQIAIILGYANATSISTVKFRLAQKMGLDCPLNDYINRIISASDSSM